MTRCTPLLGLTLAACVCLPPEPCVKVTEDVDGGVHWFRLPVHPSAWAIELENLDDRDGLLVPRIPGPVSFSIESECQRQRWMGIATENPFAFSAPALSFSLTRPGARAALPLATTNQTDDPIQVELRVPLGFRADSISPFQIEARGSRELFVYFEPPSVAAFDDELLGVAFSEAMRTVALHGIGGGPIINVPSDFDAGVVAAMGPRQRPDGRWLPLYNHAPAGESSADLLLPPTGTSDCPGVQVVVEEPRVLQPNSSTRILLLIPTDRLGEFVCNVTIPSAPKPFSFRAFWRTLNLPPCDISRWPVVPVVGDGGFATIELVTGLEGCRITFPHLEPADAGIVLTRWSDLDVPPQSIVSIELFVRQPADLHVNVSDPAIRSLSVSVIP